MLTLLQPQLAGRKHMVSAHSLFQGAEIFNFVDMDRVKVGAPPRVATRNVAGWEPLRVSPPWLGPQNPRSRLETNGWTFPTGST